MNPNLQKFDINKVQLELKKNENIVQIINREVSQFVGDQSSIGPFIPNQQANAKV